jgi:methylmalonyl-CoA mutase cobalamin-binding domain/chain
MAQEPGHEAASISELDRQAGVALDDGRRELSEEIVSRQYRSEPEIWERFGARGREISVRDQVFHLQYLSEAVRLSEPRLFADYVAWLETLFQGLGFAPKSLVTLLECTRDAIRETYAEDVASRAEACLRAGLDRVGEGAAEGPSLAAREAPLSDLARRYLDALLDAQRPLASRLVLEAVEGGTSVKDIYTHVFQASQREIGRLWQTNQISVAQEHYCTASTQVIMSQLYPHVFASEKVGRRLVATCVGGELHELGARMVADFFEMEGWDTYYLGANTPAESIVRAVSDRQAHVLAVSATMTFHVHLVVELVARAQEAFGDRVKVLVGGYPFNVAPDLWRRVGAHAYAPDAQRAIAMANRLVVAEGEDGPG